MTSGYLLRRLGQLAGGLLAIMIVTFALLQVAPGDAAQVLAGDSGNLEFYEAMRERLGLDLPVHQQFARYATGLLRGDLGLSAVEGRPVAEMIGERVGPTLLLMGVALVFSVAVGVLLGVLGARRPGSAFDTGLSLVVVVLYAVPAFWIAQIAVLVLAFHLDLFPMFGMTEPGSDSQGLARAAEVGRHMLLPTLVLMTTEVALVARLTRVGLVDELQKDYVRTARAKGAPAMEILSRHALPNALLPVVTVVGGRVGFLFSGAVIVETIFSWPGLGTLLLQSVQTRDNPLMLGIVLLVAVCVLVANVLTDLVYAVIDPRIRFE